MKKGVILTLLCLGTVTLFSQSGRIRISFVGFDCYRETWDDILHTDGKGDEVYFNFGFTISDKNGNTKNKYEKRTPVYGDATQAAFSNRVNVGSFTDIFGGATGGIKAGDTYRCNNIIGEYDLADGDMLNIIPTGWEHDPIADNMNSFTSVIDGMYSSINQKLAPIMIGFHALGGNLVGILHRLMELGLPEIAKAGGDQGELGKPGTRPIGMKKNGNFAPIIVALNTPNLSMIAKSNFGNGNGIIAVNYDEVAVANSRDHGNYSIFLKVEFFPSATNSSAALPPRQAPPPPAAAAPPPPPRQAPPPPAAAAPPPPPRQAPPPPAAAAPPPPPRQAPPPAAAQQTEAPVTSSPPVYKLTAVKANIRTGADNKEFLSVVWLFLTSRTQPASGFFRQEDLKNEMKSNSNTEIGLEKVKNNLSLEELQKNGLEFKIWYHANFQLDAWKIEGVSITLEFRDQNGNLHPTYGQKTITFNNASGFLNGYFERKMTCTTDGYFNPLTAQISK